MGLLPKGRLECKVEGRKPFINSKLEKITYNTQLKNVMKKNKFSIVKYLIVIIIGYGIGTFLPLSGNGNKSYAGVSSEPHSTKEVLKERSKLGHTTLACKSINTNKKTAVRKVIVSPVSDNSTGTVESSDVATVTDSSSSDSEEGISAIFSEFKGNRVQTGEFKSTCTSAESFKQPINTNIRIKIDISLEECDQYGTSAIDANFKRFYIHNHSDSSVSLYTQPVSITGRPDVSNLSFGGGIEARARSPGCTTFNTINYHKSPIFGALTLSYDVDNYIFTVSYNL